MASAAAERPGRPWRGWRGWSAFGLALAALLASAGAGRGDAPAPGERRELLVVATGGLRGWLSSRLVDPRGPAHGLAHLAPAIAGLRRSDPGLVLLDAGDALGGDPTTERPGAPAIPPILGALNRLGYDALAPGVAELAAGLETAERLRAASAFPWLAANVLRADGTPWLPAWRLLERDGLRIAVVGLSSPGVALHVEPGGLGGLRFLALPPATRAWLPRLRADARADVVIGLFHSGVDGREQREAALRRHLPLPDAAGLVADDVAGFDLIVAGRGAGPRPGRSTDTPPDHGAPLIEPGDRGNGLAVARLALSRAGGRWRVTRVTRWTLPAERDADGAMLAQAAGPLAATSAWLAEPTAVRIARAPDRRTLALCLGELAHRAALRRPFPGL
ncbi:MAG: hypothetical protein HY423_14285, partial [Candidatus Lambdaproteobacteria bacterium]|nr:hypothetical protein [Candidatus Lambdaproteobacteria bacterium]